MLNSEFLRTYPLKDIDGIKFSARYSCSDMIAIYDENGDIVDYNLIDFKLLATPEEVYQETLIKQ